MAKRIHNIMFYTLLLAVYSIFYSVESFYNFEGQINAKDIFSCYVNGKRVAKTTPLRSTSTHNIRLNKRYHQSAMPPCPVAAVEAPVKYLAPQDLGAYRTLSLPSITVIHHPLRGPPVAV